jgi:hypothetical protein
LVALERNALMDELWHNIASTILTQVRLDAVATSAFLNWDDVCLLPQVVRSHIIDGFDRNRRS